MHFGRDVRRLAMSDAGFDGRSPLEFPFDLAVDVARFWLEMKTRSGFGASCPSYLVEIDPFLSGGAKVCHGSCGTFRARGVQDESDAD